MVLGETGTSQKGGRGGTLGRPGGAVGGQAGGGAGGRAAGRVGGWTVGAAAVGRYVFIFSQFFLASAPGPLDVRPILLKFDTVEGLKYGKFCFGNFKTILCSSALGKKTEAMTCGMNHPKLMGWNVGIHDHRPIYQVSVLRPIHFA